MKRLALIPILALLFFTSCSDIPEASFYPSTYDAVVGEVIYFNNTSYHVDYCEWDFGDGTYSNQFDAEHAYTRPGVYTVMLTVYNHDDISDIAYETIVVGSNTILDIAVVEYTNHYTVPNASVRLYSSYRDWEAVNDNYIEGYTDRYGHVIFEYLSPINYFLDVWEENHNNYLLAADDIAFVQTGVLYEGEVNYFTAYVDYIPATKKKAGHYRILNLEKDNTTRQFKATTK